MELTLEELERLIAMIKDLPPNKLQDKHELDRLAHLYAKLRISLDNEKNKRRVA